MKKILLVTDTWEGTNGVITTLKKTKQGLEASGFHVTVIHPGMFPRIPLPFYREIKIGLALSRTITKIIKQENPEFIHIATEGPLGLVTRRTCINHDWQFTTTYHTKFPEYLEERIPLSLRPTYAYVRWFHRASSLVFVATPSLKEELTQEGFHNLVQVPLGVDSDFFKKNPHAPIREDLPRPIFVFLGRLAPEKNITAFLECDLPGTKLVIGDGPYRTFLEKKYHGRAVFTGYQKGEDLINLLSIASVFVFPSKTDTFGLVILEAMACGLPAAGFNVPGPKDLITHGVDGYIGDNLQENILQCLKLNPELCRAKALQYTWEKHSEQFIANQVPIQKLLF